jgi:hypothetical protein
LICGRILRVLPEGIVVESGYTNLLRKPLVRSWLVPATAVVSPNRILVESKEPEAVCVGQLLLTNLPPRGKPHPGDYVIICGYPAAEITYNTVGTLRKTSRRYSASLEAAVKAALAAGPTTGPSPPPTSK